MKDILDIAVRGGLNKIQAKAFLSVLEIYKGQEIQKALVSDFVLSHDFLKAFFINSDSEKFGGAVCNAVDSDCDKVDNCEYWQFHAQQLVLAEDRMKYLKDYMEGD